jgi:hypothetical protein
MDERGIRGFFISGVPGFFENDCASNPRSAGREHLF